MRGYLDKVPVKEIGKFESEALRSIKANHADLLKNIREEKMISEATDKALVAFFENFTSEFVEEKEAA